MIVPVRVHADSTYELTRKSLEEMWNTYAKDELEKIGLQVKQNIVLIKGRGGDQFLIQISSTYACKHTNTAVDTR
jgi:hypothetical protein